MFHRVHWYVSYRGYRKSGMLEGQRNEKLEMANIHTILFIIFSLMLIYDIYFTTKPTFVRIENPKFTLLGPYNTTQVKTNDVYDQLIDIKKFSFKINPQPCKDYTGGLLLVIIVPSKPSNYENRVVIRNTWGKSVDSTKVVFLIGETTNSTITKKVQHESNIFGDIVQGNFADAYRNMTYKHVMGLKWVAHHCPMAKYVLKADDDIVVNSREMRKFLVKELSPWGARGLIACQVLEHALAQRLDSSKWKVTNAEYGLDYYPTYCAGWAILYSQDVVTRLLEGAQSTPFFWIDDVHITGIVAQNIGVARTSMSGLFLTPRKANLLRNLGPKYVGQFVFGPPDLSTNKIMQIWKAIPA